MQVAQFVRKYSASNVKSGPVARDKIDSTLKWVEYAADLYKMTQLLKTASFDEKYRLAAAMEIAERKKSWHYRQDNFNLRRASFLLQAFLSAK
jgi:hypothetical protein